MIYSTLAISWSPVATHYVLLFLAPTIGAWIFISECFVGILVNQRASKLRVIRKIIIANLISLFLGYWLTRLVATPPNPDSQADENFVVYALLGYLFNYVMSLLIEGQFLRISRGSDERIHPYKTAFVCNTVSYLGIILGHRILILGWALIQYSRDRI